MPAKKVTEEAIKVIGEASKPKRDSLLARARFRVEAGWETAKRNVKRWVDDRRSDKSPQERQQDRRSEYSAKVNRDYELRDTLSFKEQRGFDSARLDYEEQREKLMQANVSDYLEKRDAHRDQTNRIAYPDMISDERLFPDVPPAWIDLEDKEKLNLTQRQVELIEQERERQESQDLDKRLKRAQVTVYEHQANQILNQKEQLSQRDGRFTSEIPSMNLSRTKSPEQETRIRQHEPVVMDFGPSWQERYEAFKAQQAQEQQKQDQQPSTVQQDQKPASSTVVRMDRTDVGVRSTPNLSPNKDFGPSWQERLDAYKADQAKKQAAQEVTAGQTNGIRRAPQPQYAAQPASLEPSEVLAGNIKRKQQTKDADGPEL